MSLVILILSVVSVVMDSSYSDEMSSIKTHTVRDANSTGVEQGNAEVSLRKICNVRDGKSVAVE